MSAAYSSARSSQAKCPASSRSSLLLGRRSWRYSALTQWHHRVSRAIDDLHRRLDLRQAIAEDRKVGRVSAQVPQTLGGYTVSTFAQASAIFDAMNCSDAINCLAGHLLAAQLDVSIFSSISIT